MRLVGEERVTYVESGRDRSYLSLRESSGQARFYGRAEGGSSPLKVFLAT